MIRIGLAAAVLAVACSSDAPLVQEEREPDVQGRHSPPAAPSQAATAPGLAPNSARILKPIGKPLTISFPDAAEVTLHPSEVQLGEKVGCAVTLREGKVADQTIVTIGENETEALTCGRLKASGAVSATPPMQRIALLYEAYGPHATVLQPVILHRTGRGAPWQADDALAQTISEDGSLNSIPAIRRWLGRKR